MFPTREIFWNIPFGPVILYPLSALVISLLAYSFYKRYRLWRIGKGKVSPVSLRRRLSNFILLGLIDGLGHRRLLKDPYPGLMHLFLFWGCLILFIATFLDALSHYWLHFMHGTFYLVSSLVFDIFGIMVLIGIVIATYRRYIQKPKRLNNTFDDAITLALIFVVVITGFLVEGLRLLATELRQNPEWAIWSPGGFILAKLFLGMAEEKILFWHRFWWYFHTFLALGAIAYVAIFFSKLSHILVAPINAFFVPIKPKGELEPIDLEKETLGVTKIEEFSWKHLLDLDACTRCGRCQDNCPASLSGKALSPKRVIQNLKSELEKKSTTFIAGKAVTEAEIWDCTTCGACLIHCPVYINPVAKIIEIRRNLTLMQSKMPETIQLSLSSLQKRGHPWAGSQYLRLRDDWTSGLEVKRLAQDKNIDVLFWVGCTAALDERVVKVTLSLVNILKKAEVNFGILGGEETCCGDPARRIGYELLYLELAQKNISLFKTYQVKKIVTLCPHCFNTIKHEYPQLDPELGKKESKIEILHHTQLIAQLIKEGKLKLTKPINKLITYHDPCYLGRYNDIYQIPRQILDAIPGIKRLEMKRSKERSLCCGGGGGHLWIEEEKGKRVNELRIDDIAKTKAETGITACPYCLHMLQNALEEKKLKEQLQLLDIAELINQVA